MLPWIVFAAYTWISHRICPDEYEEKKNERYNFQSSIRIFIRNAHWNMSSPCGESFFSSNEPKKSIKWPYALLNFKLYRNYHSKFQNGWVNFTIVNDRMAVRNILFRSYLALSDCYSDSRYRLCFDDQTLNYVLQLHLQLISQHSNSNKIWMSAAQYSNCHFSVYSCWEPFKLRKREPNLFEIVSLKTIAHKPISTNL